MMSFPVVLTDNEKLMLPWERYTVDHRGPTVGYVQCLQSVYLTET